MKLQHWLVLGTIGLGIPLAGSPAFADDGRAACAGLPSQAALQTALVAAVAVGNGAPNGNGGLGFNMWASLVANDGTVCAVAFWGSKPKPSKFLNSLEFSDLR